MGELAGDRRGASLPPPPPLPLSRSLSDLPDDLVVEILLRLPPEPIHLFRASFVSKHWRRLVHDAGFLHRFREFHGGTPPLLGFFDNVPGYPLFAPTSRAFRVSTATMRQEDWRALDCRHGRALLECRRSGELLVWDLMTGDKRYLPAPPARHGARELHTAALCAAGHADHGDWRSCPFLVAFLFSHKGGTVVSARVYSSETGIWGEVTSFAMPPNSFDNLQTLQPPVLIGNTLYWLLDDYFTSIIGFDLETRSFGLIEDLPYATLDIYDLLIIIMRAEDGRLGFAGICEFSLHLWSRVATIDGVGTWTLLRVIDLEKFLAPEVVTSWMYRVDPLSFAEDADLIFIDVDTSIYMFNLRSMQIEEVPQKGNYWSLLPYTSFYAPAIAIGGGDDQAELMNGS